MNNIANEPEINEGWENITRAITESAKETIPFQEKSPKREWWDEECREVIKKRIWQEWNVIGKTLRQMKNIKKNRKEAYKLRKQKKELWLNNKIMQLDEANKRNDTNIFLISKLF